MAFNPSQMTESTFKGFVDKLHKFSKHTPAPDWPPKRAWVQEAIAAALGFPNYHAARKAIADQDGHAPSSQSGLAGTLWPIHPAEGFAGSSFYPPGSHPHTLQVPLASLQKNLLLLGSAAHRAREIEGLAEAAVELDIPMLMVQGVGSSLDALPGEFSRHSFKAFSGYANVIPCIIPNGSAEDIANAIAICMGEIAGGDQVWKARVMDMLTFVVSALVFLRNHHGWALDIDMIRDYLILENIQELADRRDLPVNILTAMRSYLRSLPGYRPGAPRDKQSTQAMDHHGFMQMHFTRALGGIRNPLVPTRRLIMDLDAESKQARALGVAMSEWVRRHQNGLIVLDGLEQGSALFDWWISSHSKVERAGHGLIVGTMGLSDLPTPNHRLLDRFGHWAVMRGTPPAARDAQILLDRTRV